MTNTQSNALPQAVADLDEGFLNKELETLTSMIKKTINTAIDQFHDETSQYLKKNSAYIQRMEKNLEKEVEKNPMFALMLTGGLGLLLNALLKKKPRS